MSGRQGLGDKTINLILEALALAATEPDGLPLLAAKGEPGFFPGTAAGKVAAEKAIKEGWISLGNNGQREVAIITSSGKTHLIEATGPREILEDFVRAVEAREAEVQRLSSQVARLANGMESMRTVLQELLPKLIDYSGQNGMNATLERNTAPRALGATDEIIAEIKNHLASWHATSDASNDCPLPNLFRAVSQSIAMTVGAFHDALRQLFEDHQIYLHPWTAPLYTLPEPKFALMVGHEVAFYASVR